jgi:hypothetical protein
MAGNDFLLVRNQNRIRETKELLAKFGDGMKG